MIASLCSCFSSAVGLPFDTNLWIPSRFPDDAYDRIWYPWNDTIWTMINTSSPINLREDNGYQPPLSVMNTAAIRSESSENFTFYFPTVDLNKSFQYQIFFHFAELEQLRSNEFRQFNIFIDGVFAHGPFSPVYLSADTIFIYSALNGLNKHVIDFWKTTTSTLPPILNALETFILQPLSAPPTDNRDGKSLSITYIFIHHEFSETFHLN